MLAQNGKTPKHVAIVMDGNGRWAQKRHMPRFAGHKVGVESIREIIKYSVKINIEALTVFAFSSENWKRPVKEVNFLMELFITALNQEVKKLHSNNIQLKVIGDISGLPSKLQDQIKKAEALTAKNTGMKFRIAANYGGRWDITQGFKKLLADVNSGHLLSENIDEKMISSYLELSQMPEPDLFIRTGGEKRISNFLLWQLAYTELYFTDLLWPDFTVDAYKMAIEEFSNRHRRYGLTSEQVNEKTEQ